MMRKLSFLILYSIISLSSFSQILHNEWIDYSKTYYKFKLFGFGNDGVGVPIPKGMVRIPYASLASAGLSATPAEHFQLWRDGEQLPVFTSVASGALSASDYIEFWGEINTGKLDKELYRDSDFQLCDKWSLQTDTAAYFLTVNTTSANKRLTAAANNVDGTTLTPLSFFKHTVGRYFRQGLNNGFSAAAAENLYSSSYDRGEGYVSRRIRPNNNTCGGEAQLVESFNGLYPYLSGPAMRVNINAVGNQVNSRSVKILLNNDSLSVFQMDYLFDYKYEEDLPVSKISAGNAVFTVVNKSSVECDEMKIAKMELTYPREFNMGGAASFEFSLNASAQGAYLKMANFNHGGVAPVLYDLANGKRYVGNISNPDTVKIVLQPSTVAYKLVLTTQAGNYYKSVNDIRSRNFVNYNTAANQGDYLIISNPLIYGTGGDNYVEQYKQYRSSAAGGNYKTQVVDINELVDQFAWGVKKHPLSVKNFLKFARARFTAPPKFVFLIGKGITYNAYKQSEDDPIIEQLNLVPTWGYPASDNLLSSEGEKAIPTTPIGRLSAISAQEVGDYLQKVKQYDSAQQSPVNTVDSKAWMKNVLQIAGANDATLGNQLNGYFQGYSAIIKDTAFGAKVTDYSKIGDPGGYTNAVVSFKNTYEHGSSLITYFGHSSATSLDFNLDNPEYYSNAGKYPMFIVNGCLAGNLFDYEPNRFSNRTTFSEKFVLAKQRGAIGYIASTNFGVINYLNIYTREFYKAFGKSKYNQPIGVAIQEGITQALASTGSVDFYSRLHSEQYTLHGDPAVKMNTFTLPDYVMEEPQILVSPAFISIADTSFSVKVKVHNVGRAQNDSLKIKISRQLPDGSISSTIIKKIAPLKNVDSVIIEMPIVASRDKGVNKISASLDFDNELVEMTENNNAATKEIIISEDEIRTIYPYKNAIVNTTNFKFRASTANPLSESRNWMMEIDTTDFFNSPLKASSAVTSKGGVIEFAPNFTLKNNTVYYWRVAPVMPNPYWNYASFKYDASGFAGFEQSDFYQHTKASFDKIYLDSADRKFKFKTRSNNLFIVNSIYPTSGTEDGHFSVAVNGIQTIQSACDGPALQYNVFNPITFEPWKNKPGAVGLNGSISTDCGISRQYNFDFLTTDSANRNKAARFMDSIPNGYFVVVRIVASEEDAINKFASVWQADTSKYGAGNTVYHRLKQQGFAGIDSFNRSRTFSFVYKKNDASFTPEYVFSRGIYDRVNLNVTCNTPETLGYITSQKYGPSKGWKRVKWAGSSLEPDNDKPSLQVIGFNKNGGETMLYNLSTAQPNFDISTVSADDYPYIELRLKNQDSITATPYQLSYYQVEYDAAPEGGLAPNLYVNIPDTVRGFGYPDSLNVGVAFKNASGVNFDSLSVKIWLSDLQNNVFALPVFKTRPVAAGDSVHIKTYIDINSLQGKYNLFIGINSDNPQKEQYSFNNTLNKYIFINSQNPFPVTLLEFTAKLQGTDVLTNWSMNQETNLSRYELQYSADGLVFKTIGTLAPANLGTLQLYQYLHRAVPFGKNYYRLRIVDKDGKQMFSPVRLVSVAKGIAVNIYPNPVKDKLNISVNRADGKASSVTLLNSIGQQLLQKSVNGSALIDMSSYQKGLYLLVVDDGLQRKTYKINRH